MQFETEFYANGNRATVFVIEAEEVVRSALYCILRDRYRTHAFATPEDALACVAEAPDVVLIGAAVLQNGGKILLTHLAAQLAGAKFLVVAERNSDSFARASLEHGVHSIIAKPISFDAVRNAVDSALAAAIPLGEPCRLIRAAFG
jgi:DNA-binding NarL/FixJ family response regulator